MARIATMQAARLALPDLLAFLITPAGIAVAASYGLVVSDIERLTDRIKNNVDLLVDLYKNYILITGLNRTSEANPTTKRRVSNTHAISTPAPGMPDPDDEGGKRNAQSQWNPQKNHDKKATHGRFGNFYRDPVTKEWWTKDTAGHGGQATGQGAPSWKVYEETGKGLRWLRDADSNGVEIFGKHKGPVGQEIPWKDLIIKK